MTSSTIVENTDPLTTLPLQARHHLVNSFSLSNRWHQYCQKYFCVAVSGAQLLDMVDKGEILRGDTIYKINWLTLPATCYRAKSVLLSFRQSFTQPFGYVLIVTKEDSVKFGAKPSDKKPDDSITPSYLEE